MHGGSKRSVGRPRHYHDDAVLAGAFRALTEAGSARLSVGQAAWAVGASAPLLVQRFGSRQGLLAYIEWCAASADHLRTLALRQASPLATLRAWLAATAAGEGEVRTAAVGFCYLVGLLAEAGDDVAIRSALTERQAYFVGETTGPLEAAVAGGEVTGADPGQPARLLLEILVGATVRQAIDEDSPDRSDRALLDVIDAVLAPYRRS